MKYTVIEVAKIVGATRQTIYRHIEKKPLSVEKDEEGNIFIEASELLRVYGDKINFDAVNDTSDSKNSDTKLQDVTSSEQSTGIQLLEEKLNSAGKQIEMLEIQMRREREILDEQIGTLKEALQKSQETQNKTVSLLEDKTEKNSRAGEWEKNLKTLEERIANQEKTTKEKEAEADKILRQNKDLKKALDEEKSKGFFKRLFG